MRFFNTLSLEDALKVLAEKNSILLEEETVSLTDTLGRVLSQDIISPISLPSFNRSTVDGYAVDVRDVTGASETFPTPLTMIGEVEMGKDGSKEIKRGSCIYVPTGGMMPKNSDGMVMIEDCEILGDEILISRGVSKGSNMILKGDELKEGEFLIPKGTRVNPHHVGVLASIGKDRVSVYKRMSFSIISTGDEIIPLGNNLSPGQVYDINTHILLALIQEAGGEVTFTSLVKDDMALLEESLKEAVSKSQAVLISGGSSVGIRDFTEKAIEKIGGELFLHGLAVKPGKPTICAVLEDKLIFGLPGHPQSAANIFRTFVEPTLIGSPRKEIYAELGENLHGDPGKSCFINVKLIAEGDRMVAYPVFGKSSMIRTLMESSGYVVIPEYREGIYRGENIKVVLNNG